MFLGKDEHGDFILDPNEPAFGVSELERAEDYLERWHAGRRKAGQPPAGLCPHEDYPCVSDADCIPKIAWWRRYIREIEGL